VDNRSRIDNLWSLEHLTEVGHVTAHRPQHGHFDHVIEQVHNYPFHLLSINPWPFLDSHHLFHQKKARSSPFLIRHVKCFLLFESYFSNDSKGICILKMKQRC
jgi:hypothetical protein